MTSFAFSAESIFCVTTWSFAPNFSSQNSPKASIVFWLPVTGRNGQKKVGIPIATVHAALATAFVRLASGKEATIGNSLRGFFPALAMESKNSVTPPFSQLPKSITAGRLLPIEERRPDNPFPQRVSRCLGFKRPYFAKLILAHPSEMQKTSPFNSSRASETTSLSWVNLTLLHPAKRATPLIFPAFKGLHDLLRIHILSR